MSYILDALRKSEAERRQGRVPDLGQQVQMIHKPKKKSVSALTWVALALVLNAAILAWLYWPGATVTTAQEPAAPAARDEPLAPASTGPDDALASAIEIPVPGVVEPAGDDTGRERPTVIIPSARQAGAVNPSEVTDKDTAAKRTPHLVELPLSFQKRVPDLIFNSHIYASEPSSRRVMINDNYLRHGESFSGITVEWITEEGVELSMDGRRFRVGVVRNWVSPE